MAEPAIAKVRCDIEPNCRGEFALKGRLAHGRPEEFWQHVHSAHPLRCEWVRGFLVSYLWGRPSALTDERMKMHLGECPPCRAALNGEMGKRRGAENDSVPQEG